MSTSAAPAAWRVRAARAWRTLKELLRPPRRLSFTRAGGLLTGAIVAMGFAALNTGNNLLYLVLGALLGLIMVSGWLSEQSLRRNQVQRRVPRAATAGEPLRITYEVSNHKRRLPTLSLELREKRFEEAAYLQAAWPGKTGIARATLVLQKRGVYALSRILVSTSFPFGLFIKERDVDLPGYLVVWPRTDRAVRRPRVGGERARQLGESTAVAGGVGRGEYRGLRSFRPGDDPRDVHWRSTARLGQPVVREYERESNHSLWVCLDLRAAPDERAEEAVELASSICARAINEGQRVGLATNEVVIDAGAGAGQLERILDSLARARFRPEAPVLALPADGAQCVLVTASRTATADYADVFVAGET